MNPLHERGAVRAELEQARAAGRTNVTYKAHQGAREAARRRKKLGFPDPAPTSVPESAQQPSGA